MISHATTESFQQRLARIKSGEASNWTEPGGGLASGAEGRGLTRAIQRRSGKKQKSRGLGKFVWLAVFAAGGYFVYQNYGAQIADFAMVAISGQQPA